MEGLVFLRFDHCWGGVLWGDRLFPNMFPSSLDPSYSLTAENASSTPLTLKILPIVALIFIPIVVAYQTWAYNLFEGKIPVRTWHRRRDSDRGQGQFTNTMD